jgi:hypothetical protein
MTSDGKMCVSGDFPLGWGKFDRKKKNVLFFFRKIAMQFRVFLLSARALLSALSVTQFIVFIMFRYIYLFMTLFVQHFKERSTTLL